MTVWAFRQPSLSPTQRAKILRHLGTLAGELAVCVRVASRVEGADRTELHRLRGRIRTLRWALRRSIRAVNRAVVLSYQDDVREVIERMQAKGQGFRAGRRPDHR